MVNFTSGLSYIKIINAMQTSGHPLWNCVILVTAFVFTPVLSLSNSLSHIKVLQFIVLYPYALHYQVKHSR